MSVRTLRTRVPYVGFTLVCAVLFLLGLGFMLIG